MIALTMRDFRSNLASSFDLKITPALAGKIEKARQEHREGKTLRFESAAAAQEVDG